MLTLAEIRHLFLDYFAKNDHEIIDSSTLVPHNDPTLMFTNSGMVQFKDVFTGLEKQIYTRAATSQKCVRAGGKHNDLENVGMTARHHTFFEMLGNFSFGDYFKDQAIELAWKMVTQELGLPKDKLLVTIYHDDHEALQYWKSIAGLSDKQIIPIATFDNFWQMGDTGACGPCSEIFYDHGSKIPGGPPGSVNEDGDRFIEIWNLVFMQYEQFNDGRERIKLPKPSIDTGMGLERITAVLQGKHNNFDIDLFQTLIAAIADLTKTKSNKASITSHRVIADHIRAIAFLIAEGVMPSNEGRGYVLRRIMRRAMRHANLLGVQDPILFKLLDILASEMGNHYSELTRSLTLASQIVSSEESKFSEMLTRGLHMLKAETAKLSDNAPLDGKVAFTLYDTYGFPFDLTQDILKDQNRIIDVEGFQEAMSQQKQLARKAWAGSGEIAIERVWFEILEKTGPSEFLGYQFTKSGGALLAILNKDCQLVEELASNQEGALILNQTPFYGESGGQEGDRGLITTSAGDFLVTDTQIKAGKLFVHFGQWTGQTPLLLNASNATLNVCTNRRNGLRRNHSATHLLHQALREHLGEHVAQKGSLVRENGLRFDFTCPSSIDPQMLIAIEDTVNAQILANHPVTTRLMKAKDAISAGAVALFGEKYPEEVRVLSMGSKKHSSKSTDNAAQNYTKTNDLSSWSIELCGGTHVENLGEIGMFHILSQSSVGSGIRRIEAITGNSSIEHIRFQSVQLNKIAELLKTDTQKIQTRLAHIIDERKVLQKENDKLKSSANNQTHDNEFKHVDVQIAQTQFIAKVLKNTKPATMRAMVDQYKQTFQTLIILLISIDENRKVQDGQEKITTRASIIIGMSDILIQEDYNAVTLVRIASAALDGAGGGGRKDLAQAGGPNVNIAKIQAAIKDVQSSIQKYQSYT